MNLTSKSRYALKIVMDIAHFGATQPLVRRNEIAHRQGVPTDYLDQIMIRLRAGGIVESTRGRSGGYKLARAAEKITMWDLFSTVEESMIPVECISSGEPCDFEGSCSSQEAWSTIFTSIKSSLESIQLSTLVASWALEQQSKGPAAVIAGASAVRECRAGRKCEPSHQVSCPADGCDDVALDGASDGADLNG